MKLVLDVKNVKKVIKPSKSDVIVFDGAQWYVTTREDLFKEFEERLAKKEKALDEKIAECNTKISEVNELKVNVAKQILKFSEIIEGLIAKEGK